jgi:hypothetical protein
MQDAQWRAAEVWASRAHAEAQSAARFNQLARDLKATGAPEGLVELAEKAETEETEHVDLCLRLVNHLGHKTHRPKIPTIPSGVAGLEPKEALLLQMVGMCCINETVSAAILGEMLRQAEPGRVHDTIQTILRDEIGHSRLGWAYLAYIAGDGKLTLLEKELPTLLQNAVTDELFEQPDLDDPDHLSAPLGTVPRVTRFELFEAALLDLVFLGLERFGVETAAGRAWLAKASGGGSAE